MTKIILSLLTLVSILVSGLLTTNVSALSVDNTATATYDSGDSYQNCSLKSTKMEQALCALSPNSRPSKKTSPISTATSNPVQTTTNTSTNRDCTVPYQGCPNYLTNNKNNSKNNKTNANSNKKAKFYTITNPYVARQSKSGLIIADDVILRCYNNPKDNTKPNCYTITRTGYILFQNTYKSDREGVIYLYNGVNQWRIPTGLLMGTRAYPLPIGQNLSQYLNYSVKNSNF